MRSLKIYGLTFRRTLRFAPECYDIFDEEGNFVAKTELKAGVFSLKISAPVVSGSFVYNWEISDLNMFHSEQRRDKWLTQAAEKFLEVRKKYGRNA